MKEYKLSIELVPSTCWYSNLRNRIAKEDWDILRRQIYREYKYKCGVCEAENTILHCHEIWFYDDLNRIQTLVGFIALCKMCHHVKHIGQAWILFRQGEIDYNEVINHFMKINECSKEDFFDARDQAYDEWEKRSKHSWICELGKYEKLIKYEPKPS